jgi:hypothetical protein
MMRRGLLLTVSTAAALLLATSGSPRALKEGGTFRTALSAVAQFGTIDPALAGNEMLTLQPACAALMAYPDEPPRAGIQLAPGLAK